MSQLNKLSEKSQDNSVIILGGCGTIGKPHNNITSFLENQELEVYHLDRDGDNLLGKEGAIEKYLEDIRNAILNLISERKKVHLWTNSFGSLLGLKSCEEIGNKVSSIVAIAPILNPKEALNRCKHGEENDRIIINLPNLTQLYVLNSNIEKLNPPDIILQDGLIILGSEDGLTDISELENIKGEKLEKHVLPGAKHGNTTSNKETIEITRMFYSKIISN